jgi:two-component system osmolarity sensor histidine kinase EnvZ
VFTHLTDGAPNWRGRGFGWLRSGLFWRTFFLLSLLTTVTMASFFAMSSAVQRGPQVQQTAELVISVVTITHAALTHSAPELRRELLFELVSNEGIRILPLEST